MDGACGNWLAHRDMDRETVSNLPLGTLAGTLVAAGTDLLLPRECFSHGRPKPPPPPLAACG